LKTRAFALDNDRRAGNRLAVNRDRAADESGGGAERWSHATQSQENGDKRRAKPKHGFSPILDVEEKRIDARGYAQ
jgi:hypothetical protein